MPRIFLLSAIVLCTCCFCLQERLKQAVYEEKGFSGTSDELLPEVVRTGTVYGEVLTIDVPDRFACTRAAQEFGTSTISASLKFSYEAAVEGFPGDGVGDLEADEHGVMMWGRTGYRGLFAVDRETKATLDTVPSARGDYLLTAIAGHRPELPGRILCFTLATGPESKHGFILFDMEQKKNVYESTKSEGDPNFFKLKETSYLLEEFRGEKPAAWKTADLTLQGLRNVRENKLTKLLNEKLISARVREFHAGRRILLGRVKGVVSLVVTWSADFKEVSGSPLTIQLPSGYFSNDLWAFSSDGEWLVNSYVERTGGYSLGDTKLAFHHVDPKYPQGISPPVFAGKTHDMVLRLPGCFVNHTTLGPLYIEPLAGTVACVYRLRNALPIIARKMAELGPER